MSTASTPMPMPPVLRACSLLVLPLLAACTSISPLPNQIPWKATTDQVEDIMGEADSKCALNPASHPEVVYTWAYRDQWHRSPNLDDVWGSWDLYFNSERRFIGWRLVEPSPSLDFARESFVPTPCQPATSAK